MKNSLKFSPRTIILNELKKLKAKEASVVEKRFGINGQKTTLAGIGRDLKLSRERVRQIEKEALKKLSKLIVLEYEDVILNILSEFEQTGGLILKKESAKRILDRQISQSEKENNALELFIKLLPDMELIERHNEIDDSWIHASINKADMIKILNFWVKSLADNKKPSKIDVLIKNLPASDKYKMSFLTSLPRVSKKIIETYKGEVALSEWSEYNPKTVRDKIYYVLKKNQEPMHFSEIAKAIKDEEFDHKKVIVATVHNELIADSRFVLIGRGIYALTEWGYKSGTVKEIISGILKKAESAMDLQDIFEEVQKQRVVRKNTVLINLQTQSNFKKIGHNKYILA